MSDGEPDVDVRDGGDHELVDLLTAELQAGRAELAAMGATLEAARTELARSAEALAGSGGPSGALREAVATLLPVLPCPAALVDGDLWVISCNPGAADEISASPSDAAGAPLARWPHALERSRLVRRALAEPAGPVADDDGDVAVSFGLRDDAVPSTQRFVLLVLER